MNPSTLNPRATEILDVAEQRMRMGGFDAVSYRDLAAAVGIKSASVHYHFPQKADLGSAVVTRYAQRCADVLGRPDDATESAAQRLDRLCAMYRSALLDANAVCLCCVLGAEARDIPEPVAEAVRGFFDLLLRWTRTALRSAEAPVSAEEVISGLQGAMVLAVALDQPTLFDVVADRLKARLA